MITREWTEAVKARDFERIRQLASRIGLVDLDDDFSPVSIPSFHHPLMGWILKVNGEWEPLFDNTTQAPRHLSTLDILIKEKELGCGIALEPQSTYMEIAESWKSRWKCEEISTLGGVIREPFLVYLYLHIVTVKDIHLDPIARAWAEGLHQTIICLPIRTHHATPSS